MSELIAQARSDKKWIHCTYQDLWWTPSELENDQAHGRFQWGVQNFTLEDANEHLRFLGRKIEAAQQNLADFKKRMERYA